MCKGAAVCLHDRATDREPKAGAVWLGREERVEYLREHIGLKARPVVVHRNLHFARRGKGTQRDFTPRVSTLQRRVDGVAQEIDQHLL